MKLALAVHNFPPEFTGGTERVALALARAWREDGHEVVVLAGSEEPWRGTDVVRQEADGIPVLRLPRREDEPYGLELQRPRLVSLVGEILREAGPGFLHVHHWSTLHLALVRQAARLGIPAGVTLHDLWTGCPRFFRRPPPGIRCPAGAGREECVECVALDLDRPRPELAAALAARDRGVREELEAARFVAVPSRSARALLAEQLGFGPPLEVVPHGLLEEPATRSSPPAPGGVLRIGSFGNLGAEKGVDLLVEAAAGLERVEVHLWGPFLDASFGERLAHRAAELSVPLFLHGPFGPGAPHPATRLHLAVFPSRCQETYALVVDEALAHGVPVVVACRGALPERVGEGGIAVAGGVEPLRLALARLARDRAALARLREAIPELGTVRDAARRYLELAGVAAA